MTTAMTTAPAQGPSVQELMAGVGNKQATFGQRLDSVGRVMQATQTKMMAALPKHITADRMIRVALNCIRKNPKLLDCTPASLFGAMTEAATYGWELGGVLGHAYLVPYKTECQLIPGYKGLIDLCRRSGQISTISLEVVHEGDKFHYSLGDDPHIEHVPNDRDPKRDQKPITYAYAVVKLRDGGVQRSVWSREKIDAHKAQYSQGWRWAESGDKSKGGGKKDSPWHTAWPTMAKKTVMRDMIQRGLVPVSAEYRDVIDRGVQYEDDHNTIDGTDLMPPTAIEYDVDSEPAGTISQVGGEGDDGRQDAGEEPDPLFMEEARAAAATIDNEASAQKFQDEFLGRAQVESERTIIDGLAIEARKRIKPAGKGKQGSLAGT